MTRKIIWMVMAAALSACGAASIEGDTSEVAVSVVSGSLANVSDSTLGLRTPVMRPRPVLERMWQDVLSSGTAFAATWSCTGGVLSPSFDGPDGNPYSWTPVSCSVTWLNGKTASSDWSGPFTIAYGSACDSTHARIVNQAAGCSLTRTTGSGGDTRTITGPDGNSYAITHDTNGAGTGWDDTVSPAPSNGGVVINCADGGCQSGGTLVVNGSHLTGTLSSGSTATQIWNHTVSTASSPITLTSSGTSLVVTGSITVEHNLLKTTGTTTFNSVGYGDSSCCFPTTGSVTTAFTDGSLAGKSETLSFSSECGEATLTTTDGKTEPLTLMHCI